MTLPKLVFVPGLLCTEVLWAHQLAYLSELADCSVADVTGADTIDGLAEGVLEQAPAEFALCGLSMGGIVAHAIMRLAPERVTRLALLDTSARADTPEQTVRRLALIAMVESGDFAGVIETLLPVLIHPDRLQDAALKDGIATMCRAVGPEAFLRQVNALIGRPDVRGRLATYGVPTLALCGRQDAVTPLEFHEEIVDAIPGSELAIIEECGHMSTMERPHAVTALLRQWLLY